MANYENYNQQGGDTYNLNTRSKIAEEQASMRRMEKKDHSGRSTPPPDDGGKDALYQELLKLKKSGKIKIFQNDDGTYGYHYVGKGGRKRCSKKRLRKNMICYKGTKRQLRRLRGKTRKLKAKLTKCSRRRLQKWKSTRKARKKRRKRKGRKRKGGKQNLCKLYLRSNFPKKEDLPWVGPPRQAPQSESAAWFHTPRIAHTRLHLGSRPDSGPGEDRNVTQKEADEYCAKHYLADEDENGKNDGVERPTPATRDPAARMSNKCSPAGTCLRKKGPGYTFNYSQGFYEKNVPLHEIYGSRRALQGGRKAGKTLKKRRG